MKLRGRQIGESEVRAALAGRPLPGNGSRSPRPPVERWRPGFTRDIHEFITGRHPVSGGRIRYLLAGLVEADLGRLRRRVPLGGLASPPSKRLPAIDRFESLPESAAILAQAGFDGVTPTRIRRRLAAMARAFRETGRTRPAAWSADRVIRLITAWGRSEEDAPVMLAEAMRDLWRSRRSDPFARAQARRFEAYLLLSHMDWFGLRRPVSRASTSH